MKIQKLSGLLLLMLLCSPSLFAQQDAIQKHIFSVHTGYARILGKTGGLTQNTPGYRHDLAQGIGWDAQYYFRPVNRLEVGLYYSGFSSKGSHDEGKDHVQTHYIAPQIGFYCIDTQKFLTRINIGGGKIFYRNDSEVFGKDRRVKGSSGAFNLGANVTLKLTEHWGVEADLQYIYCNVDKVRTRYHDETITVRYPDGHPQPLKQMINLSAGLSYRF